MLNFDQSFLNWQLNQPLLNHFVCFNFFLNTTFGSTPIWFYTPKRSQFFYSFKTFLVYTTHLSSDLSCCDHFKMEVHSYFFLFLSFLMLRYREKSLPLDPLQKLIKSKFKNTLASMKRSKIVIHVLYIKEEAVNSIY